MKMFSALLLTSAAILAISTTSQAAVVLTATGRTSLRGCKTWENVTPAEKDFLYNDAAEYAKTEMENSCLAFGPDFIPSVLDVQVRGAGKCAMLAQAELYLLNVSYTCVQ